MAETVKVLGVGMIPFQKPGKSDDYPTMAANATRRALKDAGIDYTAVQSAYAGFVFGESTSGQRALYEVGLTGIPIFNVNNNCATGATALYLARQAILSGEVDCVLALGFEKMEKGALGSKYQDRANPLEKHFELMNGVQGVATAPFAAQMFGGAGREHMDRYGTKKETFAKISEKARRHAANNPYALFRDPLGVEEVLASEEVFAPLTRLQCCPPTCGAAAVILVSKRFAERHGGGRAVTLRAQVLATDTESSFSEKSMMKMVGYDMTKAAASRVYEMAGVGPDALDVVELHDCFTANELISYEALGLCAPGRAEPFVLEGANTYGGKVVVNPSGGLLSKGHPLGATGVAQCVELVWQLRGEAEGRQVPGAKMALSHNVGLGGACVVSLFSRD